jgi:hypothetical protein
VFADYMDNGGNVYLAGGTDGVEPTLKSILGMPSRTPSDWDFILFTMASDEVSL